MAVLDMFHFLEFSRDTKTNVDRKNHVIYGVKLLGRQSSNKRGGRPIRYSDKALRDFAKLQEGAKINVDHPFDANGRPQPRKPRAYGDMFGEAKNVRVVLTGDDRRFSRGARACTGRVVHRCDHRSRCRIHTGAAARSRRRLLRAARLRR